MLELPIANRRALREWLASASPSYEGRFLARTPEEWALLLILRDLLRVNWHAQFLSRKIRLQPPTQYDKQIIRESMAHRRREAISRNQAWIARHIHLAHNNLATSTEALLSPVEPTIEPCRTQEQHDLFRVLRYSWSSPYTEYVGRRIRLLIRDEAVPRRPVIGLAALGSSIVHIPERDEWVGWSTKSRTDNLVFTMDAYVVGSVPPYNHLLGGKLVAGLLTTNEVRAIYSEKYCGISTQIRRRTATDLACLFTTGLFGKSSQYNRLSYNGHPTYLPIGSTRGYGTLHLSEELFAALRSVLAAGEVRVANRFGDGPIWRMRIVRCAGELLGFDSSFLLQHSFRRAIYAIPLASNAREFLRGEAERLDYISIPAADLASHWRTRWLVNRRRQPAIVSRVLSFHPEEFAVD